MHTEPERIRVYYPHGGPHWLLHWSTYNTQGHVIVARTEHSLRATFAAVVRTEPYAEVKDALLVDVVAPPPALQAAYATYCFAQRVEYFWSVVGFFVQEYQRERGFLPPGLVPCTAYAPTIQFTADDDAQYLEACQRDHESCTNCYRGLVPRGLTLTEFYKQNREVLERYEAEDAYFKSSRSWRDSRADSRAPLAADTDTLGAILADHGPHSGGSAPVVFSGDVTEIAPQADKVLLFYRNPHPLDVAPYVAIAAAARARVEEQQHATREHRHQAHAMRIMRQSALVEQLFGVPAHRR
jgi:hypothetical protein